MKRGKLRRLKMSADSRRVDARAPQALVRINIAHSPQNALIEKQGLDARAVGANFIDEILLADIERVRSKILLKTCDPLLRHEPHLAEPANIRVAKFETVVQLNERMRVREDRLVGLTG